MRLKALVVTVLFVGGVAASVAAAKGPPPGKGKAKKQQTAASATGESSRLTCKPNVSVILKGGFVSGSGSEDAGVFEMEVRQANQHGKRYVAETVTVAYDERTKFTRRGHAELDDFDAGDWLDVQARACKEQKAKKPKRRSTTTGSTNTADGPIAAASQLLARRVTGKPAKNAGTTTGTTAP